MGGLDGVFVNTRDGRDVCLRSATITINKINKYAGREIEQVATKCK